MIHLGDCLNVMRGMEPNSVDAVITDLPYGMTACKWDTVIPLESMWTATKRVLNPNGVFITTASQPFTSALIQSNVKMFKHEWVWIKNRGSNFANTVREPMKEHESILVFAFGKWTYNAQMQERTGGGNARSEYLVVHNSQSRKGMHKFEGRKHHQISRMRIPSSWQKFNVEVGLHPTQKPVALFEYLIKTYTNAGDVVLDFTMGSGTTGVACIQTGRDFIGIEIDPVYFATAERRIEEAQRKPLTSAYITPIL